MKFEANIRNIDKWKSDSWESVEFYNKWFMSFAPEAFKSAQIRPNTEYKYPILIECKSAGDFTNTNKRRKEEAIKVAQLRNTYGNEIIYCLFLCRYFDTGYLGYEAAEGIDWVWEHRITDFEKLGI